MLAYVFWHWPSPSTTRAAYERDLEGLHAALRTEPPRGFLRSAPFRINGGPLPAFARERGAIYEDWYLVDDWAALGTLNEAAVSGPRDAPHRRVATRSAGGAGGVYGLLHGPGALDPAIHVAWLTKPRDQSADRFSELLVRTPGAIDLWRRQMVLGPAPEFCLTSSSALAPPREADTVATRIPLRDADSIAEFG